MPINFTAGQFEARDKQGRALAAGLVYTYARGTTNLLASYTDYTLSVANTNPVVLDEFGRASIWLTNANYTVRVLSADGVVQYEEELAGNSGNGGSVVTVDAITAVNATALGLVDGDVLIARGLNNASDLLGGEYIYDADSIAPSNPPNVVVPAVGAGRFLLTDAAWKQGGANAAARGLSAKVRQIEVSVEDFYFSGDTDFTAAFNRGIAYLQTIVPNGGTATLVVHGDRLVSGPIVVSADGIIIDIRGRVYRASDWADPIYGNSLFVFAKGSVVVDDGFIDGAQIMHRSGIKGRIDSTMEMGTIGALVFMLNPFDYVLDVDVNNGWQCVHLKGAANCSSSYIRSRPSYSVMATNRMGLSIPNIPACVVYSFSYGSYVNTANVKVTYDIQSPYPPDLTKGYGFNVRVDACDGLYSDGYVGGAGLWNVLVSDRVSTGGALAAAFNKIYGYDDRGLWMDWTNGLWVLKNNVSAPAIQNIDLHAPKGWGNSGMGGNQIRLEATTAGSIKGVSVKGGFAESYNFSAIDVIGPVHNFSVSAAFRGTDCNLSTTASMGVININRAGASPGPNGISILGPTLQGGLTDVGVLMGANCSNVVMKYIIGTGNLSGAVFSATATGPTVIIADNIG